MKTLGLEAGGRVKVWGREAGGGSSSDSSESVSSYSHSRESCTWSVCSCDGMQNPV